MEYRALTTAEIERSIALERYAFSATPDRADYDSARLAAQRGLFVGDTLAAQLQLIPLTVRTGLGTATATGIGGVASAPETRRRGHVAALMRHAAEELRAAGVPLAILYPFKVSFYARQGFATFFERRVYQGPPTSFAAFQLRGGTFAPAGPADIPELDRLYAAALRGRFGTVVRDESWWRRRVFADVYERRTRHVYLWRDDQGRARSYLVFSLDRDRDSARLRCTEIAALDPEARAQLFAFFAGHQDQIDSVRFPAPADAPVNLLLPDPVACTVEPHFMLRLLDVPAALAAHTFPPDVAGRLTLAVRDAWLPANQGVYELELADRRCAARRLPDDAPADLACDVTTLAQIYSRYLRPRIAAAFGVLEAADRQALDLADQAFAGLAPFSSDFF